MIGAAGAPSLAGEAGRLEIFLATSKTLGFRGLQSSGCGRMPQVADLACAGSEMSVLEWFMSAGDSVFCAPEESVLMTCAGRGNLVGPPAR